MLLGVQSSARCDLYHSSRPTISARHPGNSKRTKIAPEGASPNPLNTHETKTTEEPSAARTMVMDDNPGSLIPPELSPDEIAEINDRHRQFLARVAELS